MKALVGKKVGMTQIYTADGSAVPVTVISVEGAKVVKHITSGEQVTHVQIGLGAQRKPSQADAANYQEAGFVPQFKVNIPVSDNAEVLAVGTELTVSDFSEDDYVDVVGITKGKGFQGVVKRWGFRGGPKTHGGQSGKHRSPGSIGPGTTPGKVYKGKRMAGRMGGDRKTTQNLKVAFTDGESHLLCVKGAVPGNKGSYVFIKSATKMTKSTN